MPGQERKMLSRLLVVVIAGFMVPIVTGIDPVYSLPGNATTLFLIDLHTEYSTSGACKFPVWDNYILAISLSWKHQQQNNTNGVAVYDTCGSGSRVLQILQDTLLAEQGTSQGRNVAGIISYTSTEITELISASARLSGTLHVALRTWEPGDAETSLYDSSLVVDLASKRRIQAVVELLKRLEWSYITTVSDSYPVSLLEHDLFTSAARDSGTCIQYSQTPNSPFKVNMTDLKTPGLVIFASDEEFLKKFGDEISDSTVAIVVSHSTGPIRQLFQNGVIFSDEFDPWDEFAKYISEQLWTKNTTTTADIDILVNQFGCTFNDTSGTLLCSNVTEMYSSVLRASRGLVINLLRHVDDLVTMAIEKMVGRNCTDFKWTHCLGVNDTVTSSEFSEGTEGNLEMSNISMALSRIQENNLNQTKVFSLSDASTFTDEVASWMSGMSFPFPRSQCTGWCPSCQSKLCDTARQVKYTENYHVIPGDIMLLGMFPLSASWSENGAGQCSGTTVDTNTDVLTEAFLYATQTFKTRYQGLLPNVTVGALILDTCSNPRKTLQLLINFESCLYKFGTLGNHWAVSPYITPSSLTWLMRHDKPALTDSLNNGKVRLVVDEYGNINQDSRQIYDASVYNLETVVDLLDKMNWSHVGIIQSESIDSFRASELYALTRAMNICIAFDSRIPSDTDDMYNVITAAQASSANTVILFATADDINKFFRGLTSRKVIKTWVIMETRKDMLDIGSYPLPLGTIYIKQIGIQNIDFNVHMKTLYQNKSLNPWKNEFNNARASCTNCRYHTITTNSDTLAQASDVIKGTDVILTAMDDVYKDLCPDMCGLCSQFWTNSASKMAEGLQKVQFSYQQEKLNLSDPHQTGNYIIYNLQKSGLAEVGRWYGGQLTLKVDEVKSYNSLGVPLESPRESYCFTSCDVCVNVNNVTGNETVIVMFTALDEEMRYRDSSAEFDKELWSIIVIVIAGSGGLLTIILMIYIMCKVCSGALMRRYLALGILLLAGMVLMFMSVLPFVFTPSESVCGFRFFAHGFSYAFCFAIMLTKMTTLRDYRYIGLGGEISRINQMLSVLFITGVQIAIGVEWWILRDNVVYSQAAFEQDGKRLIEKTYYACDFKRGDFLAYHSFVMFLIVLCCFYAISVRKETKNMKEARLLLVCSWFCLAIWVALVVTLLVLARPMLEAVCAIGLLATALTVLVVVYLPKLTAIARLKYEVEQAGRKENGYKIDPDFQFERPYSLPGTMHSSITDKTLSYPRSLAAFDTSLSY